MATISPTYDLNTLFAQLGEPNDEASIDRFIAKHKGLDRDMPLHKADFWTPAQAKFLRDAIFEDSDWAIVVDTLNVHLHADG